VGRVFVKDESARLGLPAFKVLGASWAVARAVAGSAAPASGDHGYRKPDRRLFQFALDGMKVAAGNALYVGNDMYRDIFGAREAGMRTVMVDSDQGAKAYLDCVPDYTITDLRDLLGILGLAPGAG